MISPSPFRLSPEITIGHEEHRRLVALAVGGTSHSATETDWLLYELDRARVVPDPTLPGDVVRMGSRVTYRGEDREERTVVLVYPKMADIAAGRVSVVTPVGAALIGLRRGQSISYPRRDGRLQAITVLRVEQPGGEPGDEPPFAA